MSDDFEESVFKTCAVVCDLEDLTDLARKYDRRYLLQNVLKSNDKRGTISLKCAVRYSFS